MGKGAPKGKSSASSATRKKAASKAAKRFAFERDDDGNLIHPEAAEALLKQDQPKTKQRGQKKDKAKGKDSKGKAPKKKQFIPPPKPPQPLPDPLDSMGLASLLPSDLVVLLRKASKKDVVTRCRALEGLLAWVQDAMQTEQTSDEAQKGSSLSQKEKQEALVIILPSWVHLFPRLALSPTRRLRIMTTQIQTLLLESKPSSTSPARAELLEASSYTEAILGPWAILCHDTDRSIERIGKGTWQNCVAWTTLGEVSQDPAESKLPLLEYLSILIDHLKTLLLSPSPSAALAMTSAHAAGPMTSAPASTSASGVTTPVNAAPRERDAKNRDDANVEEDTAALDKRLVAGALSVLNFIVANHPEPKPVEEVEPLLSSKLLWSSLSPTNLLSGGKRSHSQDAPSSSFGYDAPAVRARAWTLLRTLYSSMPEVLNCRIETIGTVAMSAAWQERDTGVQRAMLEALLPVLKARPHMWLAGEGEKKAQRSQRESDDDDSDDSSDEDEDEEESDVEETPAVPAAAPSKSSPLSYLAFLQWLQSGCGGSPALGYPTVLVFISTLPKETFDAASLEVSSNLLTHLYSALYSRELDSDPAGARAFLASYCECTIYLCSRMFKASAKAAASNLARQYFSNVWKELVLGLSPAAEQVPEEAEEDDHESEQKARKQRIKSMGEMRICKELVDSVIKLYSIDAEGSLARSTIAAFEADLSAIAESASLTCIDPLGPATFAETQAALARAINFASSLLQAQQAAKLRSRALELVYKVLQMTASSFQWQATTAANDGDKAQVKLDIQADLMAKLIRALSTAGETPDAESLDTLERVASVTLPNLTALRRISPAIASSLLAAYLPLCTDVDARGKIWSEVLGSVAKLSSVLAQVEALDQLMIATEALRSSSAGIPATDSVSGLDDVATLLATRICDADADESLPKSKAKIVVSKLMISPQPFIESTTAVQMLAIITSSIEHLRYAAIDQSGSSEPNDKQRAAKMLPDLLDCLTSWFKAQNGDAGLRQLIDSPASSGVVPAVFDLAFLVETISDTDAAEMASIGPSFARTKEHANQLWSLFSTTEDATVNKRALSSLKDHMLDLQIPVDLIVSAATQVFPRLPAMDSTVILPSAEDMQAMLIRAASAEPKCTLSILDPLVPQSYVVTPQQGSSDREGLGAYARCVYALIKVFKQDRNMVRNKITYLLHVVLLAQLVEDELLQPKSSSQIFAASTSRQLLQTIVQDAVGIATDVLSALAGEVSANWHVDMVSILQKGEVKPAEADGLGHLLSTAWSLALEHPSSSHLARLFGKLLSACVNFGSIGSAEAERWLKLGRSVSDKALILAQAVLFAIKPYVQDTPFYDRLGNELAANLSGVPPSKASTQGLSLLRVAVASAPSSESDIPLIPQQRAIFLLQSLQKWIASDEDLDEEINTRLAQLFIHLIPIVQDIPGSHIDFFFDLAESNLEVSDLSEESSLPGLYWTLRLVESLRDFALRNASLREVWKERKGVTLGLIRDLFVSLAEQEPNVAVPKETCTDLIVDLVREVPTDNFNLITTSAPLCKLMATSPVHNVQVTSYRLLSASIKEQIKTLVIESAVSKSLPTLSFPESLVENILEPLDSHLGALVNEESARRTAFGYFLSWIAVLDHFESASLQIKASLVSELERRELVPLSLLASIFSLVSLPGADRRPLNPSRWVIDEIYLDELLPTLSTLQLLSSHVYFRSLIHIPTLVREWYLDIKDRHLSMLVSTFTCRHCTPLIAARELAHLKEPDALSTLQDEAMTIKILASNEVVATYTVDEHPMEIGVKIPSDFPLHGVEIRDIKRVGVNEAQWRAWLLAVQQLITGQNGLIFDALSLFKRNAQVKFQGLEECAICYSIISPMDRSLPTKPCKTCKNKFHAGCLFKWISTSGGSTCPMCRSIL